MGIIYLIKHKASGRCYVGQTMGSLRARINKHRNNDGCPYIHNALNHYGLDSFEVSEIGWAEERAV